MIVLDTAKLIKKLACGALALTMMLGAGLAGADDAVVGEWDVELDYNGNLIASKLVIKSDGGALSGVWTSERAGDSDLENVMFEGGKLTFVRNLEFQGQSMTLNYAGMVDGDNLTGAFSSDFGDLAANGTRAAAAAAGGDSPGGLVGTWEIEATLPDGTVSISELVLTEADGKISGTLSTEIGEGVIKEAHVDGNDFHYTAVIDMGGVEAPLEFKGTLDGDKLTGAATLDMEGQAMELGVAGTRIGGAETAEDNDGPLTGEVNLPGFWDVKAMLPDGSETESSMTVEENDGKLTAQLSTPLGDVQISDVDVDGNTITFTGEYDLGGSIIPVRFAGTSGGDAIEGVLTIEMEGTAMELPIKATRGEAGEAEEALSGAVNLPGVWEVEVTLPDGTVSISELTVADADGKLSGVLSTELGEAVIDEIHIDGNNMHFKTAIDMGGMEAPLEFKGTTAGNKMMGQISLDMQGQVMSVEASGTKAGGDDTADAEAALSGEVNLPGTWEIEAELPDGTVSIVEMTLAEADGTISGNMSTEIGEAVIKMVHVDGNNIHFTAAIDMGGVEAPLEVKGTTAGDKLTATATLDMEGQGMEIKLTGTRVE